MPYHYDGSGNVVGLTDSSQDSVAEYSKDLRGRHFDGVYLCPGLSDSGVHASRRGDYTGYVRMQFPKRFCYAEQIRKAHEAHEAAQYYEPGIDSILTKALAEILPVVRTIWA